MKLIRFSADAGPEAFGFVSASGRCVAFADVFDVVPGELLDMGRFLAALPGSLEPARRAFAEAAPEQGHDPANCRLYAPVEPPSLLDFGLSPRHLRNSAGTLLGQRFGAVTGALARRLLGRAVRRAANAEAMPYYKGNHHAVIGDHDEIGRPAYTHRLDIEPELAFVVGTPGQPVAGYLIFNDSSARDVQLPEMIGTGPNRSKDFARSKGLGPWLVTPDEVPESPGAPGHCRGQRTPTLDRSHPRVCTPPRGGGRLSRHDHPVAARDGRRHGHGAGLHRPRPRRLARAGRRHRDHDRKAGHAAPAAPRVLMRPERE